MPYIEIPLGNIVGGSNIRTDMTEIESLARSLKKSGLIHPIMVREVPGGRYETVTGNRRLAAARLAGMRTIMAMVTDSDEVKRLLQQITENVQREDLTPLDQSVAYHRYLALTGISQDAFARDLGKSGSHVSSILAIARKLSHEEKDTLRALGKAQPSMVTLYTATRTQDPELRKAMINGKVKSHKAIQAHHREIRRLGRPKNFAIQVKTKHATVTVAFRKPRVSKADVVQALSLARSDVADRKQWPPKY